MTLDQDRNVEWEYLQWLGMQANIGNSNDPRYTYGLLAEQLYRKEFRWSVENDDNRAENSLYLRETFQQEFGGAPIVGPPSVYEVMISLAEKLAFDMSEESEDVGYWFRILLENSGLDRFNDELYLQDFTTASAVDNVVNKIIFRRYDSDGSGGLFPLKNPPEDQRGVELWFQLASYVLERSGYR